MFKQKFRPHTRQSFGAVFLCVGLLFVVAQKCVLWYIINEKGQPPTRWVARLVKMEIPPLSLGQSVRAVFLCSNYFLSFKVTMNVSNAMINSPKIIRS